MNAAIQHLDEALNDFDAQAGHTHAERVDADRHHGSNHVLRRRLAEPAAMRKNDIQLKTVIVSLGNRVVLEFANTGVEAIYWRRAIREPMSVDVVAHPD